MIPCQPGTNVVLRSVLPRRATSIRFDCGEPIAAKARIVVTLVNSSSKHSMETLLAVGFLTNLPPRGAVVLYDGDLSALLARHHPVSSWAGRTACELHFRFEPAPNLPAPIRVLCEYSSPPM